MLSKVEGARLPMGFQWNLSTALEMTDYLRVATIRFASL